MIELAERNLLAATLAPVTVGQEFEYFPPHMTIVRWFSMPDRHANRLRIALEHAAQLESFASVTGGDEREFDSPEGLVKVRRLNGVGGAMNDYMTRLINILGDFHGDPYTRTYNPHITQTAERNIGENEWVQFETVALFGRAALGGPKQVVWASQLGDHNENAS